MPTEQLQVMVKNLRAECGHSLSVTQGTSSIDTLKYILQRTQEELWTAFVWPELMMRADIAMLPGQYLYNYSVLGFDQIREAWCATSDNLTWAPVGYGIEEDYIKPGGDNSTRANLVQFWAAEGDQFRVWPTPDSGTANLRFKGNKPLAPFTADSDRSTLDDNLIVLFAAAELLTRAKAADAEAKAQKSQRHLQKLMGNKVSAKHKVATLGGGSPSYRRRPYDNLSMSSMNWDS